jgi:heme/copper-type cytochrome/quinol oxidase subunit 2
VLFVTVCPVEEWVMAQSPDGSAQQRVSNPARPRTGLSVLSLVLAIGALAIFWPLMVTAVFDAGEVRDVVFVAAAVAGVVLGAGAVVTGALARRRVRRGVAGRGEVALAGVVLGLAAVVVPAIILAWLAYQLYSGYQEFQQCVRGAGSAYPQYLCLKECPDLLGSLCRRAIGW